MLKTLIVQFVRFSGQKINILVMATEYFHRSKTFSFIIFYDYLNKTFWSESKIKCISLPWSDKSFLLTMKYLKLCNIKTYFWYLNLNPTCKWGLWIIRPNNSSKAKHRGKDLRIFVDGQCLFNKTHTIKFILTLLHNLIHINFVCVSLNKIRVGCRIQTDTRLCIHVFRL